MYYRTKSTVQA